MIQLEPGNLVQYQRASSLAPPWPAVICTEDMAPEDMLQIRPYGNSHVTLVLILGDDLTFRWARTTELSEYDPFVPFTHEAMVASTPGLGDAYEMANNSLEASLGLEYWREQAMHLAGVSDVQGSASGSNTDGYSDHEMQQAIRLSLDSYHGSQHTSEMTKKSGGLLTPSWSPPKSVGNAHGQHTVPAQKVTRPSDPPSTYAYPSKSFLQAPQDKECRKTLDSIGHGKTSSCLNNAVIDLTGDEDTPNPEVEKPTKKPLFQKPSLLDGALDSLNKSLDAPTSDTVDGEISESKQFVQVRIGPAQEVRMIPKCTVWHRPYFRDPRRSLLCFGYTDGILHLQHPALQDIDPADFDLAAEYLESGGFGIRTPHGEDGMRQAFAQCCTAWTVADQLGMHDFMEHIVDKLECLVEPSMSDVMLFASRIYDSFESMQLPAQYRLKEYLAMFVASNWWVYIRDEHLSEWFIERLQQLPELEGDVYERRLRALNERLEEGEEEDSEEEEDGDEDGEV